MAKFLDEKGLNELIKLIKANSGSDCAFEHLSGTGESFIINGTIKSGICLIAASDYAQNRSIMVAVFGDFDHLISLYGDRILGEIFNDVGTVSVMIGADHGKPITYSAYVLGVK